MTEASIISNARERSRCGFPTVLALALRELRGGLGGFHVFIACVALGVAVITGVGALSDSLRSGFERQGEIILGGDAALARMHVPAGSRERDWLASQGRVSETATMRTIARTLDGSDQALAELKAVDKAYPLAGEVKLGGNVTLDGAVRDGAGAAVDPILLERLGLGVGDPIKIGTEEVTIRATIEAEPDKLMDRLTYGARVLVSHETLERTGLVQPGTLVRWRYALDLPEAAGRSGEELLSFRGRVKADLPEAGFTVTDRRDPSPQVTRTLDRLRQFLTLIGVTALIVGGVGVANAVATFVDRRRKTIATMKSLGATGPLIFQIFLLQIFVIAAIGIVIGLFLGSLVPVLLDLLLGSLLPVRVEPSVSAASIAVATAYGFLVAFLFALWPLGRAELVSPGVLFRDEVSRERVWPRPRVILLLAAAACAVVGLAILTSDAKLVVLYFCLGLIAVLAVFLALGSALAWAARRLPRPRLPELALALGSLGAPGGLTRSVTLSLGAGLSLLVAVALADSSIVEEFRERIPDRSPNYFVLDIQKADYPALSDLVTREAPRTELREAPMLRGRLVRLKDVPVEQIKAPPEAEWVLAGDRGLTYAESVPEGSRVVSGAWWEAGYSGEPLVSFEADLAKSLGLEVGDGVTVNVLGRNVTARIANLREIEWESLAINFVMVFSPNTLRGAPHNLLATITLPEGASLATEAAIARSLGRAFPSVTAIRVKDALDAVNALLAKIMVAVRVAGSVTLFAGALVLAGALATAQRRRIVETAILKALGATRRRILTAHLVEYGLLATATALFAIVLGTGVAWVVLTQVMDVAFTFSTSAVMQAMGLALVLVAVFGGIGTWRILGAPVVPYLRSE